MGPDVVGYVDLHGSGPRRELGYVVGGRERWGQGFGRSVAHAGLAWGFGALGLTDMWAEAVDANVASVRILERLGMRETGRGEEATFLGRRSFYRVFTLTAGSSPPEQDTSGPGQSSAVFFLGVTGQSSG